LVGQVQINGGTAMTGGWNRSLYLAATFPVIVFNSNNTKYSAIGVDYSAAAAGMYFWVNGSSADISGTGTLALSINTGNFVTAVGSFRAPIFYDSDNTTYFIDGNNVSSLFGVAIRGDANNIGTGNQLTLWDGGGTTTSAIGFKANGGVFTNPTGAGDGYNTYLTMDSAGRGWVFRRGTGGTDFTAAYTSGWILNNGIWQANADALKLNGGIQFAIANPYLQSSSYFVIPGGAYFNSGTVYAEANIKARGGVGNDTAAALTLTGGTGGYTQINGSARSPIFYDSDNTGYYFDGASTAANALTVAGGIHVSVGNVSGQGIILADDGDIVDLNDGYCAMRFSSGVRVHSGNRTGGAVVALTNGGAVIASGDITAFGSPSDIKLKENIENIPNALEKLLTLNGVNFNYKKDGSRSTGVIAQEVEKVLPEVIYEATNPEGTEHFKAVRYGNMVGILIEAIKEQQIKIDSLTNSVNNLTDLVDKLLTK